MVAISSCVDALHQQDKESGRTHSVGRAKCREILKETRFGATVDWGVEPPFSKTATHMFLKANVIRHCD